MIVDGKLNIGFIKDDDPIPNGCRAAVAAELAGRADLEASHPLKGKIPCVLARWPNCTINETSKLVPIDPDTRDPIEFEAALLG